MNTSTKTFRNAPLLLGSASHLRRFFLALVVLGSLAATHVASAAKIELDVIMPGYGWVVVRPNSNTGGRVAWLNGRVNLISGQNNAPTNLPQLTISNDLLFGETADLCASSCRGNPVVGSVGFGNEYFGRFVYPSGHWYNEISIKIPGT